jgi:hypothetical protein
MIPLLVLVAWCEQERKVWCQSDFWQLPVVGVWPWSSDVREYPQRLCGDVSVLLAPCSCVVEETEYFLSMVLRMRVAGRSLNLFGNQISNSLPSTFLGLSALK